MKKSPLNPASPDRLRDKSGARERFVETEKRPYHPPRITRQGSVVRIALGGSPGVGDSGNALNELPPP